MAEGEILSHLSLREVGKGRDGLVKEFGCMELAVWFVAVWDFGAGKRVKRARGRIS